MRHWRDQLQEKYTQFRWYLLLLLHPLPAPDCRHCYLNKMIPNILFCNSLILSNICNLELLKIMIVWIIWIRWYTIVHSHKDDSHKINSHMHKVMQLPPDQLSMRSTQCNLVICKFTFSLKSSLMCTYSPHMHEAELFYAPGWELWHTSLMLLVVNFNNRDVHDSE